MDSKTITAAYLAGYMQKEAWGEPGSYKDLAGRAFDRVFSLPKVVSDGPAWDWSNLSDGLTADQLMRAPQVVPVMPALMPAAIMFNKYRDFAGDVADWKEDREWNQSTLGKIDNWTARHPYLTYGSAGVAVAAAAAYAIHRKIKSNQKEQKKSDMADLM